VCFSSHLLTTERGEGGRVFDLDVGTTTTAATATTATGVTAATAAATRVAPTAAGAAATTATAATAITTIIAVISGLRCSNTETNIDLLLWSGSLRTFTLSLGTSRVAEVDISLLALRQGETFKRRGVDHLRGGRLPLSGESLLSFSFNRLSLFKRKFVRRLFDFRFSFAFHVTRGAGFGEFVTRLTPVRLAGTTAVAFVTSARRVTSVEIASRALTTFAAFASAAGATSRTRVTFMITATALRVEALLAFASDDFAFELARSLGYGLGLGSIVRARGRSGYMRSKNA
jgi:hypothetical protein